MHDKTWRQVIRRGALLLAAICGLLFMPGMAWAQIFVANSTTWIYPGGNPDSGVLAYSLDGVRLAGAEPFGGPISISLSGDIVFALDSFGVVREFSTGGALLGTLTLGTLERSPSQIAVSGTELFASYADGTIDRYSTSGQIITANLLLAGAGNGRVGGYMAVSGTDLFVSSGTTIGHYSTDGVTINRVITSSTMGVFDALGPIAVCGQDLFAIKGNTIAEFTVSGEVVNPALVTGLGLPSAIAATDNRLYVANGDGSIREYNSDGSLVNSALITGLDFPTGIAVAVPEPPGLGLLLSGAIVVLAGVGKMRRRQEGHANGE